MYERILVPLDGSKVGEAALPHIEELVSKMSPETKIEVTLLQVVPLTHWIPTSDAGVQVSYTEGEMKQIRKMVKSYLNQAGEGLRSRGARVKSVVKVGHAAEEIVHTTGEIKADLVAMSTHGRSGIGRWAFGSVTDKVLRAGIVPVLTVRAPRGT